MSDNKLFDEIIEDYSEVSGGIWDFLFTFIDLRDSESCVKVIFPKCFGAELAISLVDGHSHGVFTTLTERIAEFNEKVTDNAVFIEKESSDLFGPSLVYRHCDKLVELGNEIIEIAGWFGGQTYECSFANSWWARDALLEKAGLQSLNNAPDTKLWYVKKTRYQVVTGVHIQLYTLVSNAITAVDDALKAVPTVDLNQTPPARELLKEQLINELLLRAVSISHPAFESYWIKKIAGFAEAHVQFKTPTLSGFLRGLALGLFNESLANEIHWRLVGLVENLIDNCATVEEATAATNTEKRVTAIGPASGMMNDKKD